MKKLLVSAVVGVLGFASLASADRGDRHDRGGGSRYDRQRYEASIRYERGSRNHDHTYRRYGQDDYNRRPSYDRDYVRRSDRGTYYRDGRAVRSNWGFSFGYSNYGYARDSVSLGVYYSNRPSVAYRYPGYSYHRSPDVYEYRTYVYSPGYYSRGYDSGSFHYGRARSYYCR